MQSVQNLQSSKVFTEATNPLDDPKRSAKHNFRFQTVPKFYFCCRQKFLWQKFVVLVSSKAQKCRNAPFCVEISGGNKIKIFGPAIGWRIFFIITIRIYLSKPAISSWSKFRVQKGGFFNVTNRGGNFWKIFIFYFLKIWASKISFFQS